MALKNKPVDPAALRQKARELIEQAEQIERETFERVGRLTMQYYDSGFEGFSLDRFRNDIKGVIA